jgi:DNA modification methylase/transcription initiation factor IIE alpha subunit
MKKKQQPRYQQTMFDSERPATRDSGPVTCLGMTFENDEARREHFLGLLREGLEELHAKLGGVPFTSIEDTIARLKSLEHWPVGDDQRIEELARRIAEAARKPNQEPGTRIQGLLGLYKDEVGFPHGEIEDILNLSDPPYYTACPNPFIADFIKHYGKPYDPNVPYSKEPFAADVSEGKNDPIYNAHSYHTKVPHKAIMRYILHYTEPGDVVFDGFCGTGMTGVAAQLCGDRKTVESLGYRVDDQDIIYQQEPDENGKAVWKPFSKLGARRAILNDLSPAATFIAYNYNTPVDVQKFERKAKRILKEVEEECGWMYLTLHQPTEEQLREALAELTQLPTQKLLERKPDLPWGRINYTVWSDVFVCPECAGEVIFWDVAVDKTTYKVSDTFTCPHCNSDLKKRDLQRTFISVHDSHLSQIVRHAKQVPVLIHYYVDRRTFIKRPDSFDFAILEKIANQRSEYWCPTSPLPKGDKTSDPLSVGITHIHHFYVTRNLISLAAFAHKLGETRNYFNITSTAAVASKMYRFRSQGGSLGAGGGPMNGTLYVPSLSKEIPVLKMLGEHIKKTVRMKGQLAPEPSSLIMTMSHTSVPAIKGNSLDYIFTDPPFGGNIMYSELNFIWEGWLRVATNNFSEAVVNRAQKKALLDYQELMSSAFAECFRTLKPGRWITVEFHNSKNSVWAAIQEAMQNAGFVIADVRTLDKKQGSFNAVNTAGAVKQDLVISAYKPNGGLEDRFKLTAGTEEGVWDFVRTHLKQLPVFVSKDGKAEVIAERQNYLLFDRMVAFHVQRGVTVPLSAAEFYAGLAQRFPERDGMYFLPEQVAEYDKKRMKVKEVLQLQLFVTDEASAIQWLKQQLTRKPQTFQELHPQFLKEIGGWQKHEKPLELSELLEQNFLRYDGKGEVPSQIHSYLSSNFKELRNLPKDDERLRAKAKDRWYVPDPNKAGDLEKLRERALLREFEEYRESKEKRLKVFRLEAVRAGFKKAWQERDYATIIAVARKIPENVLQEDPKLLMWYDQALTRMGE